MSQIVKLRRSSVSGQKPTNTNLQLGELALNTTDGKVYMSVSGSLGPSVEELISTNTVNTGSINLVGDITANNFIGTSSYSSNSSNSDKLDGKDSSEFAITGSNIFKGNQTISGSLITTGSNKLIGDTQLTGALIISGSTVQIGNNTLNGTTLLTGSLTISGSLGTPTVKIFGNVEQDGYTKYLPVNANINTSISASYIFVSGSTDDLYFSQNGKGFSNVTRLRWLEGNLYTGLLNGGILTATPGGTTFNVASGSGIIVSLNASLTDNPYPTVKYINWSNFTGQTLTYINSEVQTFIGIDANAQITQQVEAFNDGQYDTIITLGTIIHQNLSTVNASITYPNMAYGYKQRTYDFFKAFGPLKLSGLEIVTTNTLGLNVASGTAWADGRNYQIDPNNPSYITDTGTAVSKIFRYHQISGTTFSLDTNNASGYTTLDVTHYNNNGTLTTVPGNNVNNYEWTIQRIFWYPNSATKGIVAYYGNRTYTSATDAAANVQYEPFVEIENTKQNAIYLGAIAVRKDANWANSSTYLVLPGGIFRNVGGSGGGGSVPTARLTDLMDVDVAGATNGDIISYNTTSNKWEHGKQLSGSYQITGSLDITKSLIVGSGSLDSISPEILNVANSGSYNIARFDGFDNNYAQINVQNHHSGSGASTDFVLTADNGTENIHYVDLGINSSNYNAGYVGHENDAYLLNAGKDLYVGTIGSSGHTSNLNLFAENKWETPQIHVSGSGQVLFNTLTIASGYEYEFSGSINARHNLNVQGSVTSSLGVNTPVISNNGHNWEFLSSGQMRPAGVIMGSSYDSNQVDVSDISPLQLKGLLYGVEIKSSPDNSNIHTWGFGTDGTLTTPGDVNVNGILTAKELHIDYVTSSVLYQSGSTKFGDTSDDNHIFTGSVKIDGGLKSLSLTGSIDYNNLTNVPTLVSSSNQISYSGLTGIPLGIVSGSSQILDGSGIWSSSMQLPSGVVSGSSQVLNGSNIISGSQQVIDLGFTTTSSFQSFTSSYTNDSSSFDSRINLITGSIDGINQTLGGFELYTASLNNELLTFVTNSQTSSMTVLSSSYALTASYALNGGGGGTEGRTAKLDQTTPSTTWTFNHNLGEQFPTLTVFDSYDNVVIPTSINAYSDNTLIITFSSPQTGTVTATVGGGLPFISSSFDGRVLTADGTAPMWKGGMVSGSLQISNFGFATTGSNTFTDNQTINGTLTITEALIQQITSTGVTSNSVIASFPTGSYDGGFFDYVIKDGSNLRAGTVTSVWDFGNVTFNEATTNDLGDTTDVNMTVTLSGGNANLNANVSSGTWTIKVLSRGL
jgi:hypothetical protein